MMPLATRSIAIAVFVLGTIAVPGTTTLQRAGSEQAQIEQNALAALASLDRAEAKWAAQKPEAYEFTYDTWCGTCGPSLGPPTRFRVQQGISTLLSHDTRVQLLFEEVNTIEKLFAQIRRVLERRALFVRVTYDDRFGYPRETRLNTPGFSEGDGFLVLDFKVYVAP